MIELKDVIIFRAGENPNGVYITEKAISDLKQFNNVPILNKICGYQNDFDDKIKNEKVIGWIYKATRIDFPYIYGDILVEEEFKNVKTMKNYEIQLDLGEKENGVFVVDKFDLMSIEME